MTREQAIEILKKNRPGADPRRCGLELCTAVDVAIAALREQGGSFQNGNDHNTVKDWPPYMDLPRERDVTDINVGSKWIGVEERLPDGNAKCLVSIHYREGYDTIDVLWFRKAYKSLDLPKKGDYWLRYDSEYGDIDMTALVTHWMPLPEPPEVEV